MMAQNQDLPDIEKLGRHEFDLDLEEQNRLQAEGDAEIQRVCIICFWYLATSEFIKIMHKYRY